MLSRNLIWRVWLEILLKLRKNTPAQIFRYCFWKLGISCAPFFVKLWRFDQLGQITRYMFYMSLTHSSNVALILCLKVICNFYLTALVGLMSNWLDGFNFFLFLFDNGIIVIKCASIVLLKLINFFKNSDKQLNIKLEDPQFRTIWESTWFKPIIGCLF